MPLFRRRPARVNVGRYKPLPQDPIAPIDRVVEEGVLITASSVRMAIKNRVIVGALRDDLKFDAEALGKAAREEFLALADENTYTAKRLERLGHWAYSPGDANLGDPFVDEDEIDEEHRRRPQVHRALAEALKAEADNSERIRAIVEQARDDAWEEIGRELRARLRNTGYVRETDPKYEKMRAKRVKEFIKTDLARLRVTDD
ncbi:hypothetical protein [Mycetocola zhadangensis]|uniref:hypothetical protein n=1 Tax=Mycetocola zhadangensis TaxID=1164595 RepID=UPI0011C3E630|nr:hypothetical protein [Mycetocola zhadangensis]GGE93747.1 hypothetical protein GCM10011313_15910 [Mycetocola zhadangensis]